MTLTQIATFITNKLSQNNTISLGLCKQMVNFRYRMIWDHGIWRDSKITVTQSMPQATTDFTVDADVFLVTQVIWNNYVLQNILLENLFNISPNWQNSPQGKPQFYMNQPKSALGECVIRLDTVPDETQNVYITGKRQFIELGDNDSPLISGIDNALLAYVEGDMLDRLTQRGSGAQKTAEGQALLQEMINLEQAQQTSNIQIQPVINDFSYPMLVSTSQGYTDNWFLRGN